MDDGFRMDPARIRAVSPRFNQLGEELLQQVREAERQLTALGKPWGDDEMGAEFEKRYAGHATKANQSFVQVASALAGIGDLTRKMADNVERVDEDAAEAVGSMDDEMGRVEGRSRLL